LRETLRPQGEGQVLEAFNFDHKAPSVRPVWNQTAEEIAVGVVSCLSRFGELSNKKFSVPMLMQDLTLQVQRYLERLAVSDGIRPQDPIEETNRQVGPVSL
jgi:hypothetical protein